MRIFGEVSVEVCKDAVREIKPPISPRISAGDFEVGLTLYMLMN